MLCGALASALTVLAMGRWPYGHSDMLPTPLAVNRPAARSNVNAAGVSHAGHAVPASAAWAPATVPLGSGGTDVLAKLTATKATVVPRAPEQSNSLAIALTRALQFTTFVSLSDRKDPEGKFEAAAWAMACTQHNMKDDALRCRDERLRDPNYALTELQEAAGAGQPGAITELAVRYPMQWDTIVLSDGLMLGDHVYAMAAHGDVAGLELIKRFCRVPGACRDAEFSRNVLTALEFQFARNALPPAYIGQLEGTGADRQRAIERATALRRSLVGQRG
jgi:hypothetical protein